MRIDPFREPVGTEEAKVSALEGELKGEEALDVFGLVICKHLLDGHEGKIADGRNAEHAIGDAETARQPVLEAFCVGTLFPIVRYVDVVTMAQVGNFDSPFERFLQLLLDCSPTDGNIDPYEAAGRIILITQAWMRFAANDSDNVCSVEDVIKPIGQTGINGESVRQDRSDAFGELRLLRVISWFPVCLDAGQFTVRVGCVLWGEA